MQGLCVEVIIVVDSASFVHQFLQIVASTLELVLIFLSGSLFIFS
jgi:hypothetical protein